MKKILLLVFLLTSCSTSSINGSLSNNNSYFVTGEIKINQIFNLSVEKYLVYFYSQHCLHCLNLKKTILEFINHKYFSIFTIEITEEITPKVNDVTLTIGETNCEYVFAGATPQLTFIDDHQVQYSVMGEDDVRIMLDTFIK